MKQADNQIARCWIVMLPQSLRYAHACHALLDLEGVLCPSEAAGPDSCRIRAGPTSDVVVKMLVPEIDVKSELPRCRLMS